MAHDFFGLNVQYRFGVNIAKKAVGDSLGRPGVMLNRRDKKNGRPLRRHWLARKT